MKKLQILSFGNAEERKLAPNIRLNNGYNMPVIGLGTFEVRIFFSNDMVDGVD